MRIVMVGAGYVGLVSGSCFADFGHQVTCIDRDIERIDALTAGVIPIFEPGLDGIVADNVRAARLTFSADLAPAIENADAVFIAVGTPSRRGDGFADLTYVFSAAREIALALKRDCVVVTKSTVPVGTGDDVERIIKELRSDINVSVASNPEFLREGAAIEDFRHPNRIVIGTEDAHSEETLREIYRPLYLNQAPILRTSRRAAELIKYASNAFLATKITFINEISDLCEKLDADIQEVARGIGLDNRIGAKFLHAGPGYGGSCFPKDTLALVKTAEDAGAPLRIVDAVISINNQRKRAMARKIVQACGGSVRGKTIGVLGLTFKPNTDDMRDSPAIDIIAGLQDAGANIQAYDPEGMDRAQQHLSNVAFAEDPYACARDAHAIVLATEWNAFRALDISRLRSVMIDSIFVDLRNIYNPIEVTTHGFAYTSVGRRFHEKIQK